MVGPGDALQGRNLSSRRLRTITLGMTLRMLCCCEDWGLDATQGLIMHERALQFRRQPNRTGTRSSGGSCASLMVPMRPLHFLSESLKIKAVHGHETEHQGRSNCFSLRLRC